MGGGDMHHTDDTTIDDVASEADENDFSDLSDEALDRPPASAGRASLSACAFSCGPAPHCI